MAFDTDMRGEVLVHGNPCSGVVTTRSSKSASLGIFVAPELEFADYESIVQSRGIVCEHVGITSHLAVICRILGIPVIRLQNATARLISGTMVTLDPALGLVHNGNVAITPQPDRWLGVLRDEVDQRQLSFNLSIVDRNCIQRLNLGAAVRIEQFFFREEFLWVRLNRDPFSFLKENGVHPTARLISSALKELLLTMKTGQTLNYRVLDVRSDEFSHFESQARLRENNPQMGLHGIRQLLLNEEMLVAELMAAELLVQEGYANIIVSLPFVTYPQEVAQVRTLVERHLGSTMRIGVFIETPAAVFELPHILDLEVSSVYIGTKDLAQFILACDRSNELVSHLYRLNARAVLSAVSDVLRVCDSRSVPAFLFLLLEDVASVLQNLPQLQRLSLCASDYYRVFDSPTPSTLKTPRDSRTFGNHIQHHRKDIG
jgi:phosphoenolpyruvate-protein kinase (PTS system EI component)